MAVKVRQRLITIIIVLLVCVSGMYVCRLAIRAYTIERNKVYAYSWITKVKRAQDTFRSRYGRYGSLADLANSGVLEQDWAQASKWDYRFEVMITVKGYEASAIPMAERANNITYNAYFLDESGVIRRDIK